MDAAVKQEVTLDEVDHGLGEIQACLVVLTETRSAGHQRGRSTRDERGSSCATIVLRQLFAAAAEVA
jgi:hypothetical protein